MASSPFLSPPREKSSQKNDLRKQQQSSDRALEKEAALYDMCSQIANRPYVKPADFVNKRQTPEEIASHYATYFNSLNVDEVEVLKIATAERFQTEAKFTLENVAYILQISASAANRLTKSFQEKGLLIMLFCLC